MNGLHLHLIVSEPGLIPATSNAGCIKQGRSVSAYVQNSPALRRDAGRNRFETGSWVRKIDFVDNEIG